MVRGSDRWRKPSSRGVLLRSCKATFPKWLALAVRGQQSLARESIEVRLLTVGEGCR